MLRHGVFHKAFANFHARSKTGGAKHELTFRNGEFWEDTNRHRIGAFRSTNRGIRGGDEAGSCKEPNLNQTPDAPTSSLISPEFICRSCQMFLYVLPLLYSGESWRSQVEGIACGQSLQHVHQTTRAGTKV